MKASIVITLLAMFIILQICRAIPVRMQENSIDVRSAVAYLIRPVDNPINIPPSETKNIIHSKDYPVKFLNPFIYPYDSSKSLINIPPYLRDIVSAYGTLPHSYPGLVVIPFPASHSEDKNLTPLYPTTIASSDESSSDSSDESISGAGEATTNELHPTTAIPEISLPSTTTTEPTCITFTVPTTEKPTTIEPIVTTSEKKIQF